MRESDLIAAAATARAARQFEATRAKRVGIEQQTGGINPHTDALRIAPMREHQKASGAQHGSCARFPPACPCGGECRLCSPRASGAGTVGHDTQSAAQERVLKRGIERARKHAISHTKTPAIIRVSTDGTVSTVRSAHKVNDGVRRARIAKRAEREAAEFRRAQDADETYVRRGYIPTN